MDGRVGRGRPAKEIVNVPIITAKNLRHDELRSGAATSNLRLLVRKGRDVGTLGYQERQMVSIHLGRGIPSASLSYSSQAKGDLLTRRRPARHRAGRQEVTSVRNPRMRRDFVSKPALMISDRLISLWAGPAPSHPSRSSGPGY